MLFRSVIARDDVLDDDTAQKSREVAWGMYGQAMDLIQRQESAIPEEKWIRIPDADIEGYQEMFRENRLIAFDEKSVAPAIPVPPSAQRLTANNKG